MMGVVEPQLESTWGYKGTRRPAAEWMSMMVSTVSNRTALPAFRLVSVLVATYVDGGRGTSAQGSSLPVISRILQPITKFPGLHCVRTCLHTGTIPQ